MLSVVFGKSLLSFVSHFLPLNSLRLDGGLGHAASSTSCVTDFTLTKDLVQDVVGIDEQSWRDVIEKNIDMDVIEAQLQDIPLAKMVAQSTHAMLQAVLDLLSNVVLVLIFVVYLLEGRRRQKVERRVPGGVWTKIETRIKRYIC